IGLAEKAYEIHEKILSAALDLVSSCPCAEGCPSCVGPAAELGMHCKRHTIGVLKALLGARLEDSDSTGDDRRHGTARAD
ncbi:MAG: DUF1998 domain-containing protein, partial [Firmicutes bacterium]|nr:DUF1998 domain-containing protein [Bacillota bacterium]